jgi:hypothetical protein
VSRGGFVAGAGSDNDHGHDFLTLRPADIQQDMEAVAMEGRGPRKT